MATTNMRIVIRRDDSGTWALNGDKVLLNGEMGYEYDTYKVKIGNGATPYGERPYLAGGITSVTPGGGLTLSGTGALSFDSLNQIGDISGVTVKEYVDTQTEPEAK